MRSFPYFLGNQQGQLSPLSLNLLLKAFLSSPSPLFIVCPRRDCWNVDHRGQLRKSLNLASQRLLGGHACHFPEKHFIYQILIRLECPSSWEVDELRLLFKKIKCVRVLGKFTGWARVVISRDGGWRPWVLRVLRPLLHIRIVLQPSPPSSPRMLHYPKL